MCVSLDEPEPVDSVLTLLSGYDTLEYSWVKATAVSMCFRILFVTLQSTNKLSGTVAGERQLHYLQTQSSSYLFFFFPSTSTPATLGAAILSLALYPNGRVLLAITIFLI